MDPLAGSINMDTPEGAPEPVFSGGEGRGEGSSFAFSFLSWGCCREAKSEGGYVEFGQSGELEGSGAGRTLGTFSGVFSPVVLSMFSALLFLRVGFLVGNAGLLVTLFQFIIAYTILLFTVSSICAISTNGAVEGGGAYFMISRTLGPDLGGSIGTIFFFANVVSSALYIVGCAESIIENFGESSNILPFLPETWWWKYSYCSVLNFINLVVCLIGASMFAKTSVAIFAIVCISVFSVLLSFFIKDPLEVPLPEPHVNLTGNYTGLSLFTLQANMYPDYTNDYSTKGKHVDFAIVFGVLFSGVTGIMAGANMSGELKEPGRSIPWGTISGVLFTLFCYLAVSLLTAASCDRILLTRNYNYLMPINIIPSFITIGSLTATFSASLSNLIGSSRVLEALAKDNIYGFILKWIPVGVWRGNPLAAVFTSWLLVQIILLIGSLNLIAQINSVLFLLSYLATNLACLGLDLTSAPNFRPSFKCFSWHTALIGLLGTLVMMFVIDPLYATSSIVICLLLIVLLHLFSPSSRTAAWGSISQALIFHQVRKYLLMLDSRKEHVKFWRPQVLLLVGNPRSACPLVHFVNDMKKSGLYVLGHVIVGKEFSQLDSDPTVDQYPFWLSLVDHLKVKAFIELTVARSVREGLHHLVHISGLGAMKPNTIVLGFMDSHQPLDFFQMEGSDYVTQTFEMESKAFPLRESESLISVIEYTQLIGDILRMRKNVCIARHFHTLYKSQISKQGPYKYIDVWPVNFFQPTPEDPFDTRSSFMLQLACILQMVQSWKHLKLRVLLCEGQASMSDMTEFNVHRPVNIRFQHLLETLRITATIQQVEEWSRLRASLRNQEVSMDPSSDMTTVYINNVNSMIHKMSGETAVIFLYLPPPPSNARSHSDYLRLLTELTHDFRPTLLVHGVRAVTSTTL